MIAAIILGVLGAVWRRWFGGWRGCSRYVTLPVLVALVGGAMILLDQDPYRAAGVAAFLALWMTLGHGSYQDMGRMAPVDNERWRPVLVRAMGEKAEGTFAYDLAGMALHYGLASAIIGAAFMSPLYALVGLIPAAAYVASWAVWQRAPALFPTRGFIDAPTAPAELAIGAAFVGGLPLL